MFNFRDSHTSLERSKDVATGSTVTVEGGALINVLEAGVEKTKLATGGASEVLIGFSKLDNESLTRDAKVETITIPSASPYVVKLSHGLIEGTGPASYKVRVKPATGSDWTQAATASGTTVYQVSDATGGELTFHSADAGKTVTVFFSYTLTAVEATQLVPGVRTINNAAAAQLGMVTVMSGVGEVYTKEFDINADFSSIDDVTGGSGKFLKLAAGGKLTVGPDTSGTVIPRAKARVIKLPDTVDAHLGLMVNI